MAGQFNSANFFEVSVADKPYESISILEKVVRDIIVTKKVIVYNTKEYHERSTCKSTISELPYNL